MRHARELKRVCKPRNSARRPYGERNKAGNENDAFVVTLLHCNVAVEVFVASLSTILQTHPTQFGPPLPGIE